jgi:hypothetical protein
MMTAVSKSSKAFAQAMKSNAPSMLESNVRSVSDAMTLTVMFSSNEYVVSESVSPASVTMTLNMTPSEQITVAVFISPTSASSMYPTSAQIVTFTDSVTAYFTIPITDDMVYKGDEVLLLTISDAPAATIGTPATATLTILEVSSPPVYLPVVLAPPKWEQIGGELPSDEEGRGVAVCIGEDEGINA